MLHNEIDFAERLGRVALTPTVKRMLSDEELCFVLLQHLQSGVSRPGVKSAIDALAGCRVLTAYRLQNGQNVFVITEGDRTLTTILLPHEC